MKRVYYEESVYAINIFFDKSIYCAINTRELMKKLTRCKSSNVFSYGMEVTDYAKKVGDVVVQYKRPDGGPGDCYIYYDVPTRIYRKIVSAPSKGHAVWQYLRKFYTYDKLGDKSWHGKLPNAVR